MVKLLTHTIGLLSKRQSSIFSAATIIMVTVLLSRFLGLFRDRLLAARFSPEELGVYYAAFRIPNMIFELLVMGALATAFIPVFTGFLDTKGKDEAYKMASSVINIGTIIFILFAIPMVIFTKEISIFFAPGFRPDQIEMMVSFTRIMILAQVFPLIIGNFFTGILQSFQNFLLPSLAPVLYNLGIIAGIVFLTPIIGIYAPVVGVVIGAVLFTLIQIPTVISFGYRHNWSLFYIHPGAREVGRLMIPRTLGLAVSQIDTTVDLILSTLLGASSVTVFYFAQHLQQVPVGLFGASIAQATLPSLSSFHAKKNTHEFQQIFLSSFYQILFFVIPLSVLLIVLRIPIVRLVFGASTLFDWNSTVETGQTLAFFSTSLFAQALVHLLARAFYAMHDTKTPVIVSGFSVLLNAILSVVFITQLHLSVWSLGLSTSIANILNMLLLLVGLQTKVKFLITKDVFINTSKMILAGLVVGVALYIPIKLLDQLVFDTTRTLNLMILTGISTLFGIIVYLFLTWFMEVPQMVILFRILKKAKNFGRSTMIDTTGEIIDIQQSNL